ncbi:HTTM domain-containing protein [Leptospira interrogans]
MPAADAMTGPVPRRTIAQAVGVHLFAPIDPASAAVFRILFGLIMVWEVGRYFAYGWIARYYIAPTFFFSYPGFTWISPWPGMGMYWHFAALGVLAALITIGLFYRVAIVLFFLGFSYVFLLDQARYLNHFYLVALIAFLMIFVPASRIWSVDAFISRTRRPPQIPAWTVLLLCAQVEIMYFYAGLMKIDRDWLQGEPLREWLAGNAHLPVLGPLLLMDGVVWLATYGSIVLHLAGAPLLLLSATRLYVFIAYCVFHGLNALFWNIGIFPWFTIAATLLFFPPDWPRQIWRRIVELVSRSTVSAVASREVVVASIPAWPMRMAITGFVGIWVAIQVLIPLRFLAYPDFVSWHEQGHLFSWQMMLRSKDGMTRFAVRDPATDRTWQVDPEEFLDDRQVRKMTTRPEMIRLFAHHLEQIWERTHGTADVEVRVLSAASLNGRPSQPLIDPKRDLTAVGFSWRAADWIMPLAGPLPPREQRWFDDLDETLERVVAAQGIIANDALATE